MRVEGRVLALKSSFEAVMKAFSTSLLRRVDSRASFKSAGSIAANRSAVGLER